jgi:glycosyltransferase involved in cell wall biosynthesis
LRGLARIPAFDQHPVAVDMAAEGRYAPPIPMKICRVSVAPITRIFEKFPQRDFHLFSRLEKLGHQVLQVKISPSPRPRSLYLSYPIGILRAIPQLTSIEPDLIVADSIEAGVVASIAALAKRIPFVFDFRDNYFFLHRRDYAYRNLGAVRLLERMLPRLADQVITVDDLRRRFCLQAGVQAERLRLIPNGADSELFRPGPGDPGLLAEFGLFGRRVILYSGKINRSLDLHNVVQAMQEVIRSHPDASLLLVGDGTALLELRNRSVTLGIADHVIFAGYRRFAEIPGLIRAADVCVYPLRSVAALAIFEYMACGRPVVVPNADYDLSLPEGCCLSVEKSPEGFATGITRLLADPILASRIGAKAREVIEQQFNWDHLAEAYEAALNDAVNGRATRT